MVLTWKELIKKVRAEIRELTAAQLEQELRSGNIVLIDVRERDEFMNGHLPGAQCTPRGFLEMQIEGIAPDRNQTICLYDGGGNRSTLAARSLQEMGYANVFSLAGGLSQWTRESKPIEFPKEPDIDPQLS